MVRDTHSICRVVHGDRSEVGRLMQGSPPPSEQRLRGDHCGGHGSELILRRRGFHGSGIFPAQGDRTRGEPTDCQDSHGCSSCGCRLPHTPRIPIMNELRVRIEHGDRASLQQHAECALQADSRSLPWERESLSDESTSKLAKGNTLGAREPEKWRKQERIEGLSSVSFLDPLCQPRESPGLIMERCEVKLGHTLLVDMEQREARLMHSCTPCLEPRIACERSCQKLGVPAGTSKPSDGKSSSNRELTEIEQRAIDPACVAEASDTAYDARLCRSNLPEPKLIKERKCLFVERTNGASVARMSRELMGFRGVHCATRECRGAYSCVKDDGPPPTTSARPGSGDSSHSSSEDEHIAGDHSVSPSRSNPSWARRAPRARASWRAWMGFDAAARRSAWFVRN